MKSRFLLPSNLPETHRALSARPKTSLTRRFELRYNASPRFARRRQERRQGQALLLAVLIMLMAALLSAGFLAVVSGNLNQTARIADKTKAIEASRAGIVFANEQLSGSIQGDLWRPVNVSPVPAPGAAGYDFYYSQLDKAQGWANTLTEPQRTDPFPNPNYNVPNYQTALAIYQNSVYSKFPAPDQPSSDAPKFLVRVQEIPVLLPSDANYNAEEAKHAGELKITSIGLSDDDPNVFHTAIAYKDGRRKSPWANAFRSISNWNFGNRESNTGVPYATQPVVTGTDASPGVPPSTYPASKVQVSVNVDDKPLFSDSVVPFNVVIVKKDVTNPLNSTVRGAVVTKVTPPATVGAPAILTLASLDATIGTDEVIQKAAAIGTGSNVDLLNTGTPIPFPEQPQARGILTNGSTWLQGQIRLSDLNKFGTKITSSGSIALDGASKPVDAPATLPSPNYGIAGSGTLVSSSANNFPGTFTTDSGLDVKLLDVINDGWNKIGPQTLGLDYSTSRDVKPFEPAKIDSATNLARYRSLTRNPSDGVYINNSDDFERIGAVAMTQKDLIEMLTSPVPVPPAVSADYTRTGTAATAPTGVSLEQRHLRGWVAPDEFLARGALVELLSKPNPLPSGAPIPYIRVTYDARSDANFAGPASDKTVRDPNTGDLQPGVYSQDFPWPQKGTLFAEGNIRIRGQVQLPDGTAFPSLTVVSLGNIYIEGSVSVDSRTIPDPTDTSLTPRQIPDPVRKKLMLLAKKNVIVNPTRAVLARTDVQTVATNGTQITLTGTPGAPGTYATAADFTIPVADAVSFNPGDYAEVVVPTVADPIRGLITVVDVANKTLTIKSTANALIPQSLPVAPVIVRSPLEKSNVVTTTAMNREFFSLVNLENAINRRVVSAVTRDTTSLRNKLVFDHIGDKATPKAGLLIKAEDFDATTPRPAGFTAVLTSKQIVGAAPQEDLDHNETGVTSANKILRTYNNFSPDNKKPFNEFPTSPATVKPLSQLITEINGTQETTGGPTPEGYKYTASSTNPAFLTLPSNALAGVGLRYEPGTIFTPPVNSPANNRREDFNEDAAAVPPKVGFTIPLATSVEYNLNGGLADLVTPDSLRASKYIGFDPGIGTTNTDDGLTVDSSFYQLKTDMDKKSTLDSRVLNLNFLAATPTVTTFPQSIVLKRSDELTDAATSALLPDYEVKSMKLENIDLSAATNNNVKPVADALQIDAYVYAQEGSWLVISGDYFHSDTPVRGITDSTGKLVGSYIDYGNANPNVIQPDPGEFILDTSVTPNVQVADLNRNGKVDNGEKEAALRFVRYNMAPIKFYGAIVENQTAVVADVKDPTAGNPPIVKGAVQDWMDKWATYDDDPVSNPAAGTMNANVGKPILFSFINYSYDPSLAKSSVGAEQLRVPITDDLVYQQ